MAESPNRAGLGALFRHRQCDHRPDAQRRTAADRRSCQGAAEGRMAEPADGTGFRTVQHPVSDGQPHAASDRQDAANAFRETVPSGERRRFLAQQRHEQEHGRPARRAADEYRNGERRLRHDPPHPGAEQLPGRQRVVQVSGRTREDRSARGHSGRGQCAFVSVPGEGAGGVRLGQPGHDWRPVRRVRQRLEADVFLRGH